METYITEWMAANGTAAGCDELGFAQCYLQFNVSARVDKWGYFDLY